MASGIEEREWVERERRVLSQLALRLVDAETPRALALALCAACHDLFSQDAFHFSERVPNTDLFRQVYSEDVIGGKCVALAVPNPANHYRTMLELHEGQTLLINRPPVEKSDDEESSPRAEAGDRVTAAPLERFGDESRPSASLLFAPVTIGGELFGIVSVQSYTPYRYKEDDLVLLKALGHLVAPALRRVQAEAALHLSQEVYRRAIEQADAVPYEKDYATSRLVYMGEGIQRLTGYTPEDLVPETWRAMVQEIVLHGVLAGVPIEEVSRLTKSGEVSTYRADYRIKTRDGRERWLSDSSVTLFNTQGKAYGSIGILQDNTERMRTVGLNRELSRLGRELSAAVTPGEVARVALQTADRLIGWDACYLDIYFREEGVVHNLVNIDTVDGERREFPSLYAKPRKPTPMLERIMADGPQLVLRNSEEDAGKSEFTLCGDASKPCLSILAVPVREGGKRPIGVLSIQSYRQYAYGREDLEQLEMLADHCAGALERTMAEDRLRRSEERAATFATLAHRLNGVTTPKEAGAIIAETAEKLLGWDAFVISLYSPEENATFVLLNIDTVDGVKSEFPPVGDDDSPSPLQERVLREGAFILLRQPEAAEEAFRKDGAVAFGDTARRSLSLLNVPARKGNEVVGILSIQSYKANAYDPADLDTFQALADHCAGALARLRMERKLEEERNLLRTLIDNIPDLVFVKDRDSRFVVVNQAHYRMAGAASQEAMAGKSDFDFFPGALAEGYYKDDQRVIRTGKPLTSKDERVVGRDGRRLWVSSTKVPIRDAKGRVVGLVGISRDITESKRAREALASKARELARSNADLENFAYIASHDLQEPLRKILAFGDRLKARATSGLDEQARDYLERMQNAAARMKTLINDLLSFSRVTTQGRPFEQVDLAQVVQEVVADLEVRIEQVQGRVEVGALPTLDADPVQMRQLFQNLIGNSLKFHRPDEPAVVRVLAVPDGDEDAGGEANPDSRLRIAVEDNGIGFDEKYLDRIFVPFQRLHGKSEFEGTGIGLAVCRKIVERHGGILTAQSVPGRGSTFTIALPATQTREANPND